MNNFHIIISSLLLCSFVQAQGFEELGTFKTPSKNIYCTADRDRLNNSVTLRCDLISNNSKIPAKPKDCNLDWGNSFLMSEKGKSAGRLCHGDTVVNPNYPTLEYGKRWNEGGITCDVTKTRLRCVNRDRHGFELSKGAQKFF